MILELQDVHACYDESLALQGVTESGTGRDALSAGPECCCKNGTG